jgi:nucleoside-diphosphate-sugar epimerase
MSELNVTIPKGSLVLVTGANSYLASHIIQQFLERGYKVRGTVRNIERTSWLVQDLFKTATENGNFELVLVPNFIAPNAFDECVKGVSAIIHVATLGFDPNPNNVLPQIVAVTNSILESALKEPSVKEFVYTSSLAAMVIPNMDPTHLTSDSWNDAAVKLAWAPPPYEPARAFIVYAASKTVAEKALWEFVEKRDPNFTVNSIIPASIMGEFLARPHAELPQMFVTALYRGDLVALQQLLPTPGSLCSRDQ